MVRGIWSVAVSAIVMCGCGDDEGQFRVECGNEIVEPGEECDDGNLLDGDACESGCRVSFCGNAILDSNEYCDDGNNVGQDGCAPDCTSTCGDGVLDPNETCDDGNRLEGDACRFDCTPSRCADGVVDVGDICLSTLRRLCAADWPIVDFEQGDLDGDGDLDMLALSGKALLLYRNTGGDFTEVTELSFAQQAQSGYLRVADLDGDGDLDAVLARDRSDFVEEYMVAMNDGVGQLAVQQTLSGTVARFSLVDIDKDGDRDVVFGVGSTIGFSWLVNTGSGTFTGTIPSGTDSSDLELADLDNDGDIDGIVVTSDVLRLYRNDAGTFALVEQFADTYASAAAFGDLDGDTDLDLAYVANGKLSIRENNGAGVLSAFGAAKQYTASDLLLVDHDHDGDLDILLTTSDGATLLANDGAAALAQTFTTDGSGKLRAGDLDGDGLTDIASRREACLTIAFDDDATAADPLVVPGGASTRDVLANLDGDTDVDLLRIMNVTDVITTYRNDGNGRFIPSSTVPRVPSSDLPELLAVGDVDHDGDVDALVVHAYFDTLAILLNDGNGVFVERERFPTLVDATGLFVADLTGDDFPEVLVINSSEVRILRNMAGALPASATVSVPAMFGIYDAMPADLDGDGDRDLVLSEVQGLFVAYNDGTGGFPSRNKVSASVLGFTVGDFDGDNRADIATGDTPYVHVLLNAGGGQFSEQAVELDASSALRPLRAIELDGRAGQELVIGQDFRQTLDVIGRTDGVHFEKRGQLSNVTGGQLIGGDVNGDAIGDLVTSQYTTAVHRSRH